MLGVGYRNGYRSIMMMIHLVSSPKEVSTKKALISLLLMVPIHADMDTALSSNSKEV